MILISAGDDTVPVTVQARTTLDPRQTFDIVVPLDLSLVFKGWGGIFPGVRGADNQTGEWDHAGASRNPNLTDGSTAVETLVEYMAGTSFAYELVVFTNILGRLVHGVRGEWTFSPDGLGTLVRWCYEFKPAAAAPLSSVISLPRCGPATCAPQLPARSWQRRTSPVSKSARTACRHTKPASCPVDGP